MKKKPPFVIAVDGPAAAGKGTLTHALKAKLGFERLDSGRLYRSVAKHAALDWHLAEEPIDIEAIAQAVRTHLPLTRSYLAALDKDLILNEDKIALLASRLAPHGALRAVLREQQRAYIASVSSGIVLDGRDMGTVIATQAPCKIFLTASLDERAARRTREMLDRGLQGDYNALLNEVLKAMRERDQRDVSRAEAPLKAAEDAMTIDSSGLSLEQVLAQALRHVEVCRARASS